MSDRPANRILVLRYRSANVRRGRSTATHYLKLPYGAAFGLTEVLTRALSQGHLIWYRLTAPRSITPDMRGQLVRWQEALESEREPLAIEWGT